MKKVTYLALLMTFVGTHAGAQAECGVQGTADPPRFSIVEQFLSTR